MTMGAGLYSYLASVTDLTDEVSTRIYASAAPQGTTLPYITYHEISGETQHHQTAAAGLVDSRFQIDVWAANHTSREAVFEEVRLALDGYEGAMGSTTVDRVVIESRQDSTDRGEAGSEVPVFRKSIDCRIWFRESVPSFS